MNRRTFTQRALMTSLAASLPSVGPRNAPAQVSSNATAQVPRNAAAQVPGQPNTPPHPVPFSVMAWTLPKELTFPQQLQIAADAGYQGIEVGNEYEQWSEAEWKQNLAAQQALGLRIDSAVPGRNALADPRQRRALHDDLLRAIPGASRLGCSQFIYTAYTRVPGQTATQERSAIIEALRYAADLLEPSGMELVLEPIDLLEHKEEAVTSVVQAFDIIRGVGSPRVRVLFDFFHEQRQAGNLLESLQQNIDLVGLVHIADVPGRHRPGTGEIHYSNIYRMLAELHYRRYICMEFLPVGDPVQELRQARDEAILAMNSAASAQRS